LKADPQGNIRAELDPVLDLADPSSSSLFRAFIELNHVA